MQPTFEHVWELNIELSILLALFLVLRGLIRLQTERINTYRFWLAIPVAVLAFMLVTATDFKQPMAPSLFVNGFIDYVAAPIQLTNLEEQPMAHWLAENSLWLTTAWLLGLSLLIFRLLLRHRQLRKGLNIANEQPGNEYSTNYPLVFIENTDYSPAAYGFIAPKVYFPVNLTLQLSSEQVSLIIQHEEVHIRHKHLWLNLFWDLSICMFWFNPIFYWARNRFRHDQELYCDSSVLVNKSASTRELYGLALLQTIVEKRPDGVVCAWKSNNQLEERIVNIKNKKSLSWEPTLIGGIAALTMTSAVYAATNESELVDESRKTLNSEISTNFMTKPDDYGLTRLSVSNCSFIKDANGPGQHELTDRDSCLIEEENGAKRKMLDSELDEYQAFLISNDKMLADAPVVLDTIISGFDESAVVADMRNMGASEESIAMVLANIKKNLKEQDPSATLMIKSFTIPAED